MSRISRQVAFAAGAFALASVASFVALNSAAAQPAQVAVNSPASAATSATGPALTPADHKNMLMQYCTACHNDKAKTAGMSVVPLDADNLQANQATWEKILRRVSLV